MCIWIILFWICQENECRMNHYMVSLWRFFVKPTHFDFRYEFSGADLFIIDLLYTTPIKKYMNNNNKNKFCQFKTHFYLVILEVL